MAHIVKPVRGEVDTIRGLIVARVIGRRGQTYLHLGPTGRGFPSRLSALDFVNRSLREGIKVTPSLLRDEAQVPAPPAPKATVFVKTISKPKPGSVHVCRNGKQLRKLPDREASAAQEFEAHKRREARKARAVRQSTTRSDGVTRCSKCGPIAFCVDCARINHQRQLAGLIRPKDDPRPHPNNCLPCIPRSDSYVGARPYKVPSAAASEVTSINVQHLGGGWYLGQALLANEPVYERKFRSAAAARAYAIKSLVDIKEGLRFEALLDA